MKKHLLFVVIGSLFLAYVLYRAFSLSITYDEAWTIGSFVPLNLKDILFCNPCDANNQLLNTLLIKLFMLNGTRSLFIARLPNVLAFVIYTLFAAKISIRNFKRLTGICLFVLLLANPFLLDFFSIARGYGLALAFMMASVYYLTGFIRTLNIRSCNYSLLFGCLAVLSNFTLLNYLLAVIFLILFITNAKTGFHANFRKVLLWNIVFSLGIGLLCITPLYKLLQNHSLYYGGNNGVFQDSFVSLTAFSMYHPYNSVMAILVTITMILLFAIAVFISFKGAKRKFMILMNEKKLILILLLIIPISANLFEHYLFGTLYLIDRTALFYIPLFVIAFAALVNDPEPSKAKVMLIPIFILLTIFASVNLFCNANFHKTISWEFDSHTKDILSLIDKEGQRQNKTEMIDFAWPFESGAHYYIDNNEFGHVSISKISDDRESLNTKVDFYLFYDRPLNIVGYSAKDQLINSYKKDTMLAFARDGIYLFKNIH